MNAEVVQGIMGKVSSTLRVALPGVVEEYDFRRQKANIKLDLQEMHEDGSLTDYPVITDVPVIFPRSGSASFTMPVERGDSCLVVFVDRDLSNWLKGLKHKPHSRRQHSLNDAVAIMGLMSFSQTSLAENNTDVLLTFKGSKLALKPDGQIEITADKIKVICEAASVTATEQVRLETPYLYQKGNLKVDGDLEITGQATFQGFTKLEADMAVAGTTVLQGLAQLANNLEVAGASSMQGSLQCQATIEGSTIRTSSGVDLSNHQHSYEKAQSGSNPTIVVPAVTGSAK